MRLLMGISKNRHGTYYAVKKVPARLEQAVARVLGVDKAKQTWLKRSLGTKDAHEANKRAKAVLIEFDRTLERAEALIAPRPLRTNLSAVEIKRMAERRHRKAPKGECIFGREARAPETLLAASSNAIIYLAFRGGCNGRMSGHYQTISSLHRAFYRSGDNDRWKTVARSA
jgi:hypothetical protein